MKQDDMVSAAYAQGRRNQRESDEALLRKALEALEYGPDVDPVFAGETEDALRAALAQQEEPQTIDEAMRLPRAMAQAYENGYKAGVAHEREACVQVCEHQPHWVACAAAIRARGNT